MRKFYFLGKSIALVFALSISTLTFTQKVYQGNDADKKLNGAAVLRDSKHSIIPSYVAFQPGMEKNATEFTYWLKKQYRLAQNMDFQLVRIDKDKIGMSHMRYQQTLNGNPMEHGIVIAHIKDGKVVSFNGLVYKDVTPGSAAISATQALQKAKDHIGASIYKWELQEEENHLKWEQNDPSATYFPAGELVYTTPRGTFKGVDTKLAYKFNIYAHEPMSRQIVYVDAQTGAIVNDIEIIHHADAVGTAITGYSGSQTITADDTGSGFRLRETGRGNGVRTFNMQEGTSYGAAVDFTDADNNWNNVNAQFDQYATDAHWGAEMTYDYFLNDHGRNSIDDNGFTLNSYVHYDQAYSNAFWDGQRMTYGDGNGNPFTALDIAGHEIGHGLTSNTANLVYQDEPGGLNESFSDIFGTLVENYGRPGNWNWDIGEDLGFTLRQMDNPNAAGDPDTYFGNNWAPLGGADNGGVHTNSGVQNYWFYLCATGGTGTNDNGDNYNVTSMGLSSAADVAYRNLTVYLTTSSEYADARFFGIQSAVDLYGSCTPQVETVTNAWYAVGVGAEYVPYALADFDAPLTNACAAPLTVNFNNMSVNGTTFTWNFGDGSPVSNDLSPSHTYTANGTYTVTLDIDGGACGTDQLIMTNYIDIDPSNPCVIVMDPGTFSSQQTACTGKIYDPGGPNGNYNPNEISTIVIAPTGADQVQLDFVMFDVEAGQGSTCNYDQLVIYDGASVNDPVIGTYCNNNVPTTVASTGPAITIRLATDPGVETAGFEVDWQCITFSNPPTADFTSDMTTSCTGEIQFTDNSTDNPTGWLWDFGDGNTSTDQNPTHTYAANGNYTVTLTASNSLGSDDEVKTSFITIATPTPPTGADETVCINNSASLMASGNGTLDWYDAQTGGSLVGSGTTYTTDPLTATTTFYVEDNLGTTPVNVGPSDNSFSAGSNFAGDQGLLFDAFADVVIRSVKVYAQSTGFRTIEIRNSGNQLVHSTTVSIPDGESRVTLNWLVPAGTDYVFQCQAGSDPDLYRNNQGANFPYTAAGLVEITNSTAGGQYYYFFYDWEVQEPGCKSVRTPVTATVDSCLSLNDYAQFEYKVYPNPTNSNLTIEVMANEFDYEITNAFGQVLSAKRGLTQIETLDLSDLSKGIYFIKLKVGEVIRVEKIIRN